MQTSWFPLGSMMTAMSLAGGWWLSVDEVERAGCELALGPGVACPQASMAPVNLVSLLSLPATVDRLQWCRWPATVVAELPSPRRRDEQSSAVMAVWGDPEQSRLMSLVSCLCGFTWVHGYLLPFA